MPCSWRRLAAPSPREGGPYEWTKLAFGRLQGAIAAVPYWVTNPLWVGGSLAFIATEAWSENLFNIGSGSAGSVVADLVINVDDATKVTKDYSDRLPK